MLGHCLSNSMLMLFSQKKIVILYICIIVYMPVVSWITNPKSGDKKWQGLQRPDIEYHIDYRGMHLSVAIRLFTLTTCTVIGWRKITALFFWLRGYPWLAGDESSVAYRCSATAALLPTICDSLADHQRCGSPCCRELPLAAVLQPSAAALNSNWVSRMSLEVMQVETNSYRH